MAKFFNTDLDLYQNTQGKECRPLPQLENIVNIGSFLHSTEFDGIYQRWPKIQIFRNYEANMRIDHSVDVEPGHFEEDKVTTSMYLKYV